MKNFIFKSRDQDLHKFLQLVLTEQRAQRVDLARLTKLLTKITDNIRDSPEYPEEETLDGVSGS